MSIPTDRAGHGNIVKIHTHTPWQRRGSMLHITVFTEPQAHSTRHFLFHTVLIWPGSDMSFKHKDSANGLNAGYNQQTKKKTEALYWFKWCWQTPCL